MRSSPFVLLFASVLVAVFVPLPGAHAADPAATITIGPDGHAAVSGASGLVTLDDEQAGERYAFNLTLAQAYTIVEVRVEGGVDVERPLQLVPEIDDSAQHPDADHLHPHYFVPVARDVADVDNPAHILNVTGSGNTFTMQLGLIGPGASVLTLTRDVEAPFYQIDPPTEVTDFSFLVTTRTDEFAFGDLRVWPAAGGDPVPNPTASPSLTQDFPVQGLSANTTYQYHIVFTDWAGNEVTSDNDSVRTLPKVDVEAPLLFFHEPGNGSHVLPGERIAATFYSKAPIPHDGFLFFLDKVPTTTDLTIEGVIDQKDHYTLVYTPGAPSEPGRHTVRFEPTNTAGGTSGVTWSFIVDDHDRSIPPVSSLAVVAVVLGALLVLRRR